MERAVPVPVTTGDNITQALRYLLAAACDAGPLAGMVLADRDGLILAAAGDRDGCNEVADRVASMAIELATFRGRVIGVEAAWAVAIRRAAVPGMGLYVAAIGGTAPARDAQLARTVAAVERLLG